MTIYEKTVKALCLYKLTRRSHSEPPTMLPLTTLSRLHLIELTQILTTFP